MTTPKPQTLAEAQAERDRLAAEARAAGDRVDALAAVALELRNKKRSAWSRAVLDDRIAADGRLRAAEKEAGCAFSRAASGGADPRAPWLAWEAAADALNVQHVKVTQARAHLGEPQSETFSPSRDRPSYSAALDLVMAEAAADRLAEGQGRLQIELNTLDDVTVVQ